MRRVLNYLNMDEKCRFFFKYNLDFSYAQRKDQNESQL